jgi:hypothetical protein
MRLLKTALTIGALVCVSCTKQSSSGPDTGSNSDRSVAAKVSQPDDAQGLPELTAMRGTGTLTPPADPNHFTFVVFGDNRPGKDPQTHKVDPQPQAIKDIFQAIHDLRPAFAISLGDVIAGKPEPDDPQSLDKIKNQFDEFLTLAWNAEAPIFNAPGNHEMDDDQDVPTTRMHKFYEECVGPTYGAFTYGNSRFIALNTEDVPPADIPKPPADEEFSYIGKQQLAQLKADLDQHRDKKHIFIAMHYPIHAKDQGPPDSDWDDRLYPESREALVELFKNYNNIAYVMAAHEHLFYLPKDPDNITDVPGWKPGDDIVYFVSGGAGAPLNKGKWGFHHYLIFNVDGDNVTVKLIPLKTVGSTR